MVKKTQQVRRRDVPKTDHVARYCNPQRVIRNPQTKAVEGVWPEAFALRVEVQETYISTHWMERFSEDVDAQFGAVVRALRKKFVTYGVKRRAAIARVNAGLVVEAGSLRGHAIRIRDRSTAHDPGYCGIYGVPLDNSDTELLGLFANQCCVEVREVAEIDRVSAPSTAS